MAAVVASTVEYTNRSANSTLEATTPQSVLALGFLWLPYIIFTIVLLSLIAMSFLRFHCERGQQYRRRQEELGDKLQHLDNMRLLSSDGPQPNGGPSGCVPEQYNLFMQYSQILPEDEDDELTFTRSRGAVNGRKGGQTRRPIVFTFNSNGSMVDVRCDEEERTNTFRLIPNADSAGGDDMSVVEIDLGNGELDDLEPYSPPSSSTRHRDRRYDDRLYPYSAMSSATGRASAPGNSRRPPSSDYSGQNHLDPLSPSTLNRHQPPRHVSPSVPAAVAAHQSRTQAPGSRQHAAPPPPSTHQPHAQRHHHHHHQHHQPATSHRSTIFAPLDSSSQRHRTRHSSDEEISCAAEALLLWQKRV